MKKIKVAEVITRMDWGGSPDIFRIICSRLDPAVFDVYIIVGRTGHPTRKTKDFLEKFNDRIIFVDALVRDVHPVCDCAAWWSLYRLFRRERFDIVHTHTAKAGALGRLAAFCAGVPAIIHTPHGHNFYGYFNRFISGMIVWIERFLSVLTTRVVVLTELERQDYISLGVSDDKKTVAFPTAVEFEELMHCARPRDEVRQLLGLPKAMTVVGFVGRLEPIKGTEYLLKAARGVAGKRKDVIFVFMGEGSQREWLAAQARAWGLGDQIKFVGWQENAAILMTSFDILVLPSLNEAVGLVLIEAQAQAVPVIASRVGGIPEVVKDQETGILVPAQDPEALGAAIESLVNDPARRNEMARRGQEFVKDKFGAGRLVERLSGVYRQMLKGRLR